VNVFDSSTNTFTLNGGSRQHAVLRKCWVIENRPKDQEGVLFHACIDVVREVQSVYVVRLECVVRYC
jgi:hypothetical protein